MCLRKTGWAIAREFNQPKDTMSIVRTDPISPTRNCRHPNPSKVCTSYIERANLTVRTHCKRLARLTLAFSKKLDNFKAAIALHLAYYNFVKTRGSLRCTPAMEAGIENSTWTVSDLVNAA